jgi:hypothetical protein
MLSFPRALKKALFSTRTSTAAFEEVAACTARSRLAMSSRTPIVSHLLEKICCIYHGVTVAADAAVDESVLRKLGISNRQQAKHLLNKPDFILSLPRPGRAEARVLHQQWGIDMSLQMALVQEIECFFSGQAPDMPRLHSTMLSLD